MKKTEPPAAISKSLERALHCEMYFAYHYMADPAMPQPTSPLMVTGQEFHAYRQAYVNHLIEAGLPEDAEWVRSYLELQSLSDDTGELIERDNYKIDPELVIAVELYLSVNKDFAPQDWIENADPGNSTLRNRDVYAAGFLDLVMMNGETLIVDDTKSGWSTKTVSPYEPMHYSALAFAHFPRVQQVIFRWDFARVNGSKQFIYRKDQFEDLKKAVHRAQKQKRQIRDRWHAGENLSHNPFAGLCVSCNLQCPSRTELLDISEIPPIQTEAEARRVAALLYQSGIVGSQAREALDVWLNENGGRLALDGNFVAEVVPSVRKEYPLPGVLEVLNSQDWDVPVDKLVVGATKLHSYAKAKKRAGLQDQLDRIASRKPTSQVVVHRTEEQTA